MSSYQRRMLTSNKLTMPSEAHAGARGILSGQSGRKEALEVRPPCSNAVRPPDAVILLDSKEQFAVVEVTICRIGSISEEAV